MGSHTDQYTTHARNTRKKFSAFKNTHHTQGQEVRVWEEAGVLGLGEIQTRRIFLPTYRPRGPRCTVQWVASRTCWWWTKVQVPCVAWKVKESRSSTKISSKLYFGLLPKVETSQQEPLVDCGPNWDSIGLVTSRSRKGLRATVEQRWG